MVTESQIDAVRLNSTEFKVCQEHAKAADTRGRSNIDSQRRYQADYQLVGQVCEAALYLWFGRPFSEYDARRKKINLTPRKGDGGFDLIDQKRRRIDVKGSLHRTDAQRLNHHLYVREKERTADRYVLAIVEPDDLSLVRLVGWWPDYLFNSQHNLRDGDRYDVPAPLLYPMRLYWGF